MSFFSKKSYYAALSALVIIFIFNVVSLGYLKYINFFDSMEQESGKDFNSDFSDLKKSFGTSSEFKNANELLSRFKVQQASYEGLKKMASALNFKGSQIDFTSYSKEMNGIKNSIESEKSYQKYVQQVNQFNQYVSQNKWPTLTRVMERFAARSDNGLENAKSFNYNLSINLKDIDGMERVVKSANLDEVEKKILGVKLGDLREATNSVFNINQETIRLFSVAQGFDQKIGNFFKELEGVILSSQITKTSNKDVLSNYLGINFLLLIGSIFLVIFVQKRTEAENMVLSEKSIVQALDQVVVKNNIEFSQDHSMEFQNATGAIQDYIKKRMSYGQMFQDGLPLPAVMLDSNLKVRWFNKHFIEHWSLENELDQRENLNWDYLSHFTNIGSSEPIIESLDKMLSGIFQIQIKTGEVTKPYQMYVCPVLANGTRNVLLFFYPLMTMEETIEIQTRSIINPIHQTLKALVNGRYTNEFEQQSLHDYKIGGIEEIHSLFAQYYQKIQFQFSQVIADLNNFEMMIKDNMKAFHDVQSISGHMDESFKQSQDGLTHVKNDIINLFNTSSTLQQMSAKLAMDVKYLAENFSELFKANRKTQLDFQRFIQSLPSLSGFKTTIKESKDGVVLYKNLVNTAVKNLKQQIEKTPVDQRFKIASLTMTLKEMTKLPEFFMAHEKMLINIDVFFSKVIMLVEDTKKQSSQHFIDDDLSQIKKMHELGCQHEKEVYLLSLELGKNEQNLVDGMKSLYASLVSNMRDNHHLREIANKEGFKEKTDTVDSTDHEDQFFS